MLIEIHMIQNHSPSNLNRDDLGAPKTCLFGGVTRARISSQSLKRSIRNPGSDSDVHNRGAGLFAQTMAGHIGRRTKFFPWLVEQALANSTIPQEDHQSIVRAVQRIAESKDSREAESAADAADLRPKTKQLIHVSPGQADRFVHRLEELRCNRHELYRRFLEEGAAKLDNLLAELRTTQGCGAVDIALFGRMTTSDAFEDVEAAMQVAHAISTHEVVTEVDYFTAVDDLGKAGGGAGHVDEAMFNSACFYKYFSLDWDQLVSNLAGLAPQPETDPDGYRMWHDEVRPQAERLAAATVGHFLRAAALTTPTGKQNSFAAHNEPCGILVEIKDKKIPTSYANAFAEPVVRIGRPDDDTADEKSIEGRSVACLADHVYHLRRAHGIDSTLLWYSPKLWRFPLQYWERSDDGSKLAARLVTENRFDVLGGVDGETEGLVEAVVKVLGFDWSGVKDAGTSQPQKV